VKGIILAGGKGTRLYPLTKFTSKQLLPVFDKPLIYYPLSTLMLAGIREIQIIVARGQTNRFSEVLGDGSQLGINISYIEQYEPSGIAQSLIISEQFIDGDKCALILGDNIFYGPSLGRKLASYSNINGTQIFGYRVGDPSAYGIAVVNEGGKVLELIEKPVTFKSNIAIPGLYFFDNDSSKYAQEITPSLRGELEIVDVLKLYQKAGKLNLEMLPRGTAWFDSGTFADLHDAASFIRLFEERTGERVGDPYEISKIMGWIK
jgi:glucose-1-phosphate thymidylyltransferase